MIHVYPEATITEATGYVGNFVTKVKSDRGITEIKHGATVIATGAEVYRPTEYLYGQDERVLTHLELEERINQGDEKVTGASSLVMIQCVGCRNEDRNYCSRVCCSESVKNALKLKGINPAMDIYAYNERTHALTQLTTARGYDAEASYSPDGQWIAFTSMRDAYNHPLSAQEQKQLEVDPSYFAEIYIMRADGSGQRRLTTTPGYDGGPFFSPDGRRIIWRRFDTTGVIANVFTMALDGSDVKQDRKSTRLNSSHT